jgi:hypothetical protein
MDNQDSSFAFKPFSDGSRNPSRRQSSWRHVSFVGNAERTGSGVASGWQCRWNRTCSGVGVATCFDQPARRTNGQTGSSCLD